MTERPHEFCSKCGAPPKVPHDTDCPALEHVPAAWRVPNWLEELAAANARGKEKAA